MKAPGEWPEPVMLIENATKAAQCADLLCQDLRALAVTDNLILHDAVIAELQIAAAQRIRLERIAANLKQMEVKS